MEFVEFLCDLAAALAGECLWEVAAYVEFAEFLEDLAFFFCFGMQIRVFSVVVAIMAGIGSIRGGVIRGISLCVVQIR